jgi:hypothetical protein
VAFSIPISVNLQLCSVFTAVAFMTEKELRLLLEEVEEWL